MASGTRSKRGCWTCRIRKKKCDENIPECNACLSLSIYCYAFNQKPEWVDGGEREREGATRIKNAVKVSMNRRAALHASLRKQNRRKARGEEREESQVSPLAEHLSPSLLVSNHGDSDGQMPGLTPEMSSHSDKSPNTITTTPPSASNHFRRNEISIPGSSAIHDLATLTLPPFSGYEYEEEADDEDGRSTPPRVLADHRERLLMHFLDHVFPIEFPFYNPSVSHGGRGWLLSLLIRTSPLYHAALSVSAYHHSALNVAQNLRCKIQTWEELQKHHTLALKELYQIVPELVVGGRAQEDVNRRINALASIVQMIAFELFVGGAEIWKTHLQAAIALFTAFLGPPATCKTAWEAITNPRDRHGRKVYSANTCAAIFLSAVLIWFDILACVSTGLRPLLHEYHEPLLTGLEPLIRLDEVMGCRSEVMIFISHIAELEAWKRECRDGGKLNNMKLVMRATSIAEKLEAARQILNEEVQQSKRAEEEVSRLFATAALVYLHVVVSGFQYSLPEIRENVATAMTMFRELSNERLLRSLVWPLCVTGCMATNEQEEWFKELVMGMSAEVYMFGGARNALRIMEKCWQKRDQRGEEWDWEMCMNSLGCLVLIV